MKSLCVLALLINYVVSSQYLPILIWHSAGETCCDSEINSYVDVIKSILGDDVYVKTVRIGKSAEEDKSLSLFTHPFDQIRDVCNEINDDENFKGGFNGIGLSQGALLIRGLLQECKGPQMMNLISLAGPQQGVFNYPQCARYFGALCDTVQFTLKTLVYTPFAQQAVAPASYWHDPDLEELHLESSTFLTIINNEKEVNLDYIERIKSLEKLVLVRYTNDESIIPKESAHFGYIKNNEPVKLVDMDLYKKDRLGLRHLHVNERLIFLESKGYHLQLFRPWFAENIIKYLKVIKKEKS